MQEFRNQHFLSLSVNSVPSVLSLLSNNRSASKRSSTPDARQSSIIAPRARRATTIRTRPPFELDLPRRQQLQHMRVGLLLTSNTRAASVSAVSSSNTGVGCCQMIGPASYSLSTKWTVTPVTLAPYSQHRLVNAMPVHAMAAERRDERRVDVHHTAGEIVRHGRELEEPGHHDVINSAARQASKIASPYAWAEAKFLRM